MIRAFVLALGLLAAIHPAAAEDGRALVVAGQVMLERTAPGAVSTTALAAGAEIRSGDTIRTGGDGRVQIRFSDGSIVALQPDTAFRVDEYRYERNERRAFFFLLRGALRTMTGAIGKTNHDAEYRLKTPTATVGVRGTEYVAEQTVCDPRCSPGSRAGLRVAVSQGRIVLLTAAGEIEVGTGESAAAESADAPPQPTERGPVLPPISLSQPRERIAGRTATAPLAASAPTTKTGPHGAPIAEADTQGAPTAETEPQGAPIAKGQPQLATTPQTPSGTSGSDGANADAWTPNSSLADAWPRFVSAENAPPAASVSPNERRDSDGALLPVVERFAPGPAPSDGENDGGTGGSDGAAPPGSGSGVPDEESPPPSAALSAGLRPVGSQAAPGTGLALHVLDPWRMTIGPNVREGSLELDGDLRLSSFEWCRSDTWCRIARGNTNVAEAGHDAWTSWGRWTSGQAVATATDSRLHIPGNEGLHYLVGVPSTTLPTSGVFGYQLIGATQATLSAGGPGGSFGGNVAVAFSPAGARVGIEANVAFPNGAYSFVTPGGVAEPARSPLATGPGHAFGGELTATGSSAPLDCAATCAVRVNGGLYGPDAARVGITYRITGSRDGSTISGVGVFGKKNP